MTSPSSPIETAARPEASAAGVAPGARNGHVAEEEFLAREAADAKAALERSWAELRKHLRAATDVRVWARRYPLPAAGAALGVGFVTGLALGAPKKQKPAVARKEPRKRPGAGSRILRTTLAALLSGIATNVGALLRDSEP